MTKSEDLVPTLALTLTSSDVLFIPMVFYSNNVSGNRRIVFRFEEGDAYVVDYEDYH